MDLVYDFIKKLNLTKTQKIVIGVSSGPDSMCLLDILRCFQKEIGFSIIVAHINHKVRYESDEEEEFLKNYCNLHDIIFESTSLTNYNKGNFESFARKFRYDFFKTIINKYQASYLMTAHHGDDLIETILMKLTRGSNLKGYQGISLISNYQNYKIVRPLLYVTKDDILKYLNSNNVSYRNDYTNDLDDYTRNRYRHYVLSFLKKENKDVHLKFLKFEQSLEESNNYLNKVMLNAYNNCYNDNTLNIDKFLENDLLIQKLIIENIFNNLYFDLSNISFKHVDLIFSLINNSRTGLSINLPGNIIVVKEYGYLKFLLKKNRNDYKVLLSDGLVINEMKFITLNNLENGNDTLHLSSKSVKLPLYVRNRKNGDYIELKGSGRKKIKDIFIDCKISREIRDSYPIVVDSNDTIVWIPKLKKSKYDCENADLCDIIFKCL